MTLLVWLIWLPRGGLILLAGRPYSLVLDH